MASVSPFIFIHSFNKIGWESTRDNVKKTWWLSKNFSLVGEGLNKRQLIMLSCLRAVLWEMMTCRQVSPWSRSPVRAPSSGPCHTWSIHSYLNYELAQSHSLFSSFSQRMV
jgi:hypothetical protein